MEIALKIIKVKKIMMYYKIILLVILIQIYEKLIKYKYLNAHIILYKRINVPQLINKYLISFINLLTKFLNIKIIIIKMYV